MQTNSTGAASVGSADSIDTVTNRSLFSYGDVLTPIASADRLCCRPVTHGPRGQEMWLFEHGTRSLPQVAFPPCRFLQKALDQGIEFTVCRLDQRT